MIRSLISYVVSPPGLPDDRAVRLAWAYVVFSTVALPVVLVAFAALTVYVVAVLP